MERVAAVLTTLHHGEGEEEKAVALFLELLDADSAHEQRRRAFSSGVVQALLGLLRSSEHVGLLANVARCFALMARGSDEARASLAETDLVSLLLELCLGRNCPLQEQTAWCWSMEWVPVYEQALVALRALSFLSLDHQHHIAELGGIKLVIDLCTDDQLLRSCHVFSPAATRHAHRLTVGQKLIAQVALASADLAASVLLSFPALSGPAHSVSGPTPSGSGPILSPHYPAYLVNLATPEGVWIANELIASGSVWPDLTPFPTESKVSWTAVYVTQVSDAGHVWCQFCLEKSKSSGRVAAMSRSLGALPPPSTPASSPELPLLNVGDVYAVYFEPSLASDPGCLATPQWVRARLLEEVAAAEEEEEEEEEKEEEAVMMLAIDFGVTLTVPRPHIRTIPPECRGVPPQAIPCRLVGVAPLPASVRMLENGAAVLRNMAFDQQAFRREIMTFGGVQALLKLSGSHSSCVVVQAVAALLNLAISADLREEMGRRGVVEKMLELCGRASASPALLGQVLGCLQNLLLDSVDNALRLLRAGGHRTLLGLLEAGTMEEPVLQVLCNLVGPQLDSVPDLREGFSLSCPGGSVNSPHGQRNVLRRRPPSATPPRERLRHTTLKCLVMEDQEGEGEEEEEVGEEGEGVLVGSEDTAISDPDIVSGSVAPYWYLAGSKLPCSEDNQHAFIDVSDAFSIPRCHLRRTVCALANTGKHCSIFIAVRHSGTVCGVHINRHTRDHLSVEIDDLMRGFDPTIKHDRYRIQFIPVIRHRDERPQSSEQFVLRLELSQCARLEVHTLLGKSSQRCYYRLGTHNDMVSPQQLRDIVAGEQAREMFKEVRQVEEQIAELSVRAKRKQAEAC